MTDLKITTSVAPYVTFANAHEAIRFAHEDGFAGVEFNEDHLHRLLRIRPKAPLSIKEYSRDRRMTNSLHKSLHRPSIDSPNQRERRKAIDYTLRTIDLMEAAEIPRIILHSFSDLPDFFRLRQERADKTAYYLGLHAVRTYGYLAPILKVHRRARAATLESNFMSSLSEIVKYASEKKVHGEAIQVVFEEHYSDSIDYDRIPYGKGKFSNLIRGIDTAHQLIRTKKNSELSDQTDPIHFHAVDTNGRIDDHRTIGTGKVNFLPSLSSIASAKLTATLVLEDGTRKSALESKDMLLALIKRASLIKSSIPD